MSPTDTLELHTTDLPLCNMNSRGFESRSVADTTPVRCTGPLVMDHDADASAVEEEPDTLIRFAPTIAPLPMERYECIELIGRGAMADVFKAIDRRLTKPWRNVFVAVKVFHSDQAYGEQTPLRIDNEVVAARDVRHPNVCQVYDVVDIDEYRTAIIMEHIEGQTLSSIIKSGAEIDFLQGAAWAADIALGLAAAHDREIVHRDLKPDNIMIRASDGRACLLDFGVAKYRFDVSVTQQGTLLGTPIYMAPEQFEGLADPTSDLYALGLILARVFAGELPLVGDRSPNDVYRLRVAEQRRYRILEHAPDVPRPLARIIDRMLEFDASKRFQTGTSVADALRLFIETSRHRPNPTPVRMTESEPQRVRGAPRRESGSVTVPISTDKRRPMRAAIVGLAAIATPILILALSALAAS